MKPDQLPLEIQSFLRERIHSFEELEVLLRLRAEPQAGHTIDEVALSLNLSTSGRAQ